MQFAHMKGILKLDRLRLRGLSGAKDEVLLAATAQTAVPRQIPLPPAAIGRSHLCGVAGLPSVCTNNAVRRFQQRTPQADQCLIRPSCKKQSGFATQSG